MSTFVQLFSSGLALGAVYALVALGFVVIYRASEVFNFAHGELLTIGAFFYVGLAGFGLPLPVALIGAMVGTGLVGAVLERTLLRPLVGQPVFVVIILTIFLGAVLRAGIVVSWGTEPFGVPTPWDTTGTFELLGARILWNNLAGVVAGGVALGAFFVMIRRSRLGVAMRATSVDQEVSLALGIPVGRIFGLSWFIAGALAALAGVFLATFPRQLDANLGFIALRAFPAVIVGGLDSVAGPVIAGFALGLLEVLAQGYVNPHLGAFGHNFHAVFPYVVMIAFLVVRPHGLFGRADVERL